MNWSTAIKPFPSYLNLFLINKLNFYFYFLDSCSRHGWQSTCDCNPFALATQLKSTCNCNPLANHLQSTGTCNPPTIQWKMRSTGNCNPLAIHWQLQTTGRPTATANQMQHTMCPHTQCTLLWIDRHTSLACKFPANFTDLTNAMYGYIYQGIATMCAMQYVTFCRCCPQAIRRSGSCVLAREHLALSGL